MSVLREVVEGRESAPLVVIQDTIQHCGMALLRCMTNQLARRVDQVHVFVYDKAPAAFLSGFDPSIRSRLLCHDGWSDPVGWNGLSESTSPDFNLVRLQEEACMLQHIARCTRPGSVRSIGVVIASITPVVIHTKIAATARELHQLVNPPEALGFEIAQVIGVLHADVHEESIISAICHQASTILRLSHHMSIAPVTEEPMGYCELLHKRRSGKVLRQKEGYSVDHDYGLIVFPGEILDQDIQSTLHQPDPTANLTFNLSLRESERKAKENVVLPYTSQQQSIQIGNNQRGTGQIYYEPDEADDIDDEDPDDDLDI
ncbi:elongator complex protein 5-like [Amphiura filiformis]|uniref:elongator complex protein 5-like n=1 Tax=Amphiura filiformis TaxID=82378 RepID=UPI003B20BF1E